MNDNKNNDNINNDDIDIELNEIDINDIIINYKKILIIGNNKKIINDIINSIKKTFIYNHTILTQNNDLLTTLNNNKIKNIYNHFSPLLIDRCFRENWLLYMDSYPYNDYLTKFIEKNIYLHPHTLVIINENNDDNNLVFMKSNIVFDYIFITENENETNTDTNTKIDTLPLYQDPDYDIDIEIVSNIITNNVFNYLKSKFNTLKLEKYHIQQLCRDLNENDNYLVFDKNGNIMYY